MPSKDILTEVDGQKLKLTNLDKILYPSIGITKAQFIQYYLSMSETIMPYIRERPITMIRFPDGVNGKKFYSKSKPSWTPDWVRSYVIYHDTKDIDYVYLHNKASLAWLANLACLEIHPTQFKVTNEHRPDHFIFDLDPDENMGFDDVKSCAKEIKKLLKGYDYHPLIKTSGGKGLHIYVPINPEHTYEVVTKSVKDLAKEFVSTDTKKYTLQVSKGKRQGKILIDIYRNHLGNTCVAPYSTRGKPGAPISMPIIWDHLEDITHSQQYNLLNYRDYLDNHGDAWKEWEECSVTIHTKRRKQVQEQKQIQIQTQTQTQTQIQTHEQNKAEPGHPRMSDYISKRDFNATSEPSDSDLDLSRKDEFVLQMHDATNLHYDLRLEHEGTLWSWAIPKGLPIKQGIKRLAIQTEDHPVKYLDFEGTIPKGSYGGGTMWVMDKGKTEWVSKKSGKSLKFKLKSKLVDGTYKLYRLRDDQWLVELMDEKTTANSFKPMLANSRKKVPGGSDYIYEVKWDGIRAFVILNNEKIKIVSRSGRDITSQFPEFQKPDRFEIESGVFDSEIVVLDKEGKPQFHNVISRMHSKNGSNSKSKKATCYLFDALEVDGIDITGFPFMKRREILEATVKKDRRIRLSDVFTDGQLLFNAIESKSMEGIMAKKKNGKYAAGERSDNWLKIKCRTDDSAYIIGYTLGKGDRAGGIGALHLAKKHQDQWQYMGKVGTGFDTVKLKEVYELLEQLPTTDKPINETIEEPDRTVWVEAKYQCEITYASLSSNGTYREPVFKKLID